MDNSKNHWIAIYLSGQYPWKYVSPDRLRVLFAIRLLDGTNFWDSIISLLHWKEDFEYYKTLLDNFQKLQWEEWYNKLLQDLSIPNEVAEWPNKKCEQKGNKEEKKWNENDFSESIYKEMSKTIDPDLKKYFFNWLKTKDYWVYLREVLTYLSIYLRDYHNKVWLPWEKKEWEAVEAIFKNKDLKITEVDLTTEDGRSKKEWLYKLLLWVFKNYRNILFHNKSDDLDIDLWEYIETFLFVNQLIREVKAKFPLK